MQELSIDKMIQMGEIPQITYLGKECFLGLIGELLNLNDSINLILRLYYI